MLKKYLWSIPACNLTENERFHICLSNNFDRFSKQLFFPEYLLVFIVFINIYYVEILIFFSSFKIYLLKNKLDRIFWKCYCLFLYVVYQCEHVLFKLGEPPPPHIDKRVFLRVGWGWELPYLERGKISLYPPRQNNKQINK